MGYFCPFQMSTKLIEEVWGMKKGKGLFLGFLLASLSGHVSTARRGNGRFGKENSPEIQHMASAGKP